MIELLKKNKVVICVGSGGVGKTTLAASLGFLAAQEGLKALVITIDPAQRLKTTLSLTSTDVQTIQHPSFKADLHATLIDPKNTFDEFVAKYTQNDEIRKKILNNRLYVQLSTTLSGSQEFTALEKLYSAYEKNEYDLIILDTPPTKHAIDFLEAPQKLARLFQDGVAQWLRQDSTTRGWMASVLHSGTKQVLKILESLTGSEFMRELGSFFSAIEKWQDQLEQRIVDVQKLLTNPQTAFVLVTSFDSSKLKEAEYFAKEIRKSGHSLKALIINRVYPLALKELMVLQGSQTEPLAAGESQVVLQGSQTEPLAAGESQVVHYFQERINFFTGFLKNQPHTYLVKTLPEIEQTVSDVDSVMSLLEWIRK